LTQKDSAAIENDLQLLLDVLPPDIKAALPAEALDSLVEIVLDLGRLPEARYGIGFQNNRMAMLGNHQVVSADLAHVVARVGYFTNDNRAGIPRTLHRISAIRNRQGDIIGLTLRVGKVLTGTIEPIRDLIDGLAQSGKSLLLLGRPGVGKTTKLREIAKLLADVHQRRVVIVDTANEIAGDGDIPHPAVGRARRMQVATPEQQKAVMIEAVQNHTPEVIVVDEIGTEDEAQAARTIAERGVILIATAHGSTLESVVKNPMLVDLVGGIQSVTLGDDEAKRRATQKTVLEREKQPTFDLAVEIRDRNTLAIYQDVAEAVDHMLRGWTLFPEVRKIDAATGGVRVLTAPSAAMEPRDMLGSYGSQPGGRGAAPNSGLDPSSALLVEPAGVVPQDERDLAPLPVGTNEFRVFLYGIGKGFVDRTLERLHLRHVRVTKNIHDAHAVLVLRGNARPGSKVLQLAQDYEVPVFYAKTNTMPQIQRAIRDALKTVAGETIAGDDDGFGLEAATTDEADGNKTRRFRSGGQPDIPEDEMEQALLEAQQAVTQVIETSQAVELTPRRSFIRRLQHELVDKHQLISFSVGDEPNRRLKIVPPRRAEALLPADPFTQHG
jgi:stage III sporulation protein SpoIIIAA